MTDKKLLNNDQLELVSIIMPAYNSGNFIGEALDSIINQTYSNWEVIVVDDCSTDETSKIVKKYTEKHPQIKYYRLEKNSGAAIARNKAIDEATGTYLAFLDSDDTWMQDKLFKQITYMEENGYNFTCTSYKKIDEDGKNLNRTIKAKRKSDYNGVLKQCPGNSTVIYNAQVLGKFKIPDIKKRNDYVMWLKVIKKEKYLYGMEEPLGSHRVRTGSISSKKTDLVKYHWYVYRNFEELSIIRSTYLILYWIANTVFRLR